MLMKMRMDSRRCPLRSALVFALLLMPALADGADIEVTNTTDEGPGSLRQALLDANPGDRIVFHSSLDGTTIALDDMLPLIEGNLTIVGENSPNIVSTPPGDVILRVDNGRLAVVNSIRASAHVASDGELSGTGEIARIVTNEGTLSAGTGTGSIGTLTFGGDLTIDDGEIVVDIQPTNTPPAGGDNDFYDVSGEAAINGGTVVVRAGSGVYNDGMTYEFLTADSFGGTGFTDIVDDLAFFNASLVEGGDPVDFQLQEDTDRSFADVAASCNQRATGTYLNSFRGSATGDFSDVVDRFLSSTTDEIQSGLEQLGGEIYPTLASAQLQHTSLNLAMLRDQLALELPRRGEGMKTSGWVRGYGISGEAEADDCGTHGYRTRLGGTEVAFQRGWDIGLAIGAFGNFGWSDVELDGLNQHAQVDSYQFGGSFQHVGKFAYLLGIGGGGFQNYEVDRTIDAAMLSNRTRSEFDGDQTFGYLELGTLLETGGFYWVPHTALQFIDVRQDEFTESSADANDFADSANLIGESIEAESLRSILGLSLERTGATPIGPATTKIRAGWMHEYLDTHQTLQSRFAGPFETEPAAVSVQGVDLRRDWAVLDATLQWTLHPGLRLLGSYQGQFNGQQDFHTGAGGLEARW